jgi:hypothetical protein
MIEAAFTLLMAGVLFAAVIYGLIKTSNFKGGE